MTKEDLQNYQALKSEVVYLHRQVGRASDGESAHKTWKDAEDRVSRAILAIETALEGLKPAERQVLRLRYIDGLSWTQVCLRAHYSRAQAFRIHAAALKQLAK